MVGLERSNGLLVLTHVFNREEEWIEADTAAVAIEELHNVYSAESHHIAEVWVK